MTKKKQEIEMKTTSKPKTREILESICLTITELIVQTNEDENKILKIRFFTKEIAEITYKTEVIDKKYKMENGFKVLKEEKRFLNYPTEIPTQLFYIREKLNEFGKVRIIATVNKWNKKNENTGKINSIHFLSYTNFNTFYPIDKNNKEIKFKK